MGHRRVSSPPLDWRSLKDKDSTSFLGSQGSLRPSNDWFMNNSHQAPKTSAPLKGDREPRAGTLGTSHSHSMDLVSLEAVPGCLVP